MTFCTFKCASLQVHGPRTLPFSLRGYNNAQLGVDSKAEAFRMFTISIAKKHHFNASFAKLRVKSIWVLHATV